MWTQAILIEVTSHARPSEAAGFSLPEREVVKLTD